MWFLKKTGSTYGKACILLLCLASDCKTATKSSSIPKQNHRTDLEFISYNRPETDKALDKRDELDLFEVLCAKIPVFEDIKKRGFIHAVLWDEITTTNNICNYAAPWGSYEKLSLTLSKLQPHKKEVQDHFYAILHYYNKHDAQSSAEQKIKKDAIAIIYDKVLDAFEYMFDIDPLKLDTRKIVHACPKSDYVLDAFIRKYQQKELSYYANKHNDQQELCKKIREKLKELEAERKLCATTHQVS